MWTKELRPVAGSVPVITTTRRQRDTLPSLMGELHPHQHWPRPPAHCPPTHLLLGMQSLRPRPSMGCRGPIAPMPRMDAHTMERPIGQSARTPWPPVPRLRESPPGPVALGVWAQVRRWLQSEKRDGATASRPSSWERPVRAPPPHLATAKKKKKHKKKKTQCDGPRPQSPEGGATSPRPPVQAPPPGRPPPIEAPPLGLEEIYLKGYRDGYRDGRSSSRARPKRRSSSRDSRPHSNSTSRARPRGRSSSRAQPHRRSSCQPRRRSRSYRRAQPRRRSSHRARPRRWSSRSHS